MTLKNRLVYSTDSGRLCPDCQKAIELCACEKNVLPGDGNIKIKRETKGRGGKTVTTVSGIPLASNELKTFAKKMKQACGTGGSVKSGIIEIQGDQRGKILQFLKDQGYEAKLAGG